MSLIKTPKLKTKAVSKKLSKTALKNATEMNEVLDDTKRDALEDENFSALEKQIESEVNASWEFIKPKWDEWALRLKLYNNQKRDKESVGDNTLFTIFQTVFASLYEDQLTASFEPREIGDDDTTENLTVMAEFDYSEMEKDMIDYDWIWETMFFGRGLVAMMDFDRETFTPVPEIWNVMTVYRDPLAKSVNGDKRGRGRSRWLYRENRVTKSEMEEMGVYFNLDGMLPSKDNTKSLVDENLRIVAEASGVGDVHKLSPDHGDNKTYRIIEGFTRINGKLVFITYCPDSVEGKRIIRFHQLSGTVIPIVDRALFPIPGSWDSVSIPDLVEDKQRARAVLTNLGIKGVKANLHPMYLFDSTRISNQTDLNFEFNKFIPVNGNPAGAVAVMPKDAIKQDVQFILDALANGAERSTATPDIQQGARPNQPGTATRDSLVAQRADTRYSLAARIFGWSEKRFWKMWYQLYKEHFNPDIDRKNVRISGVMGAQWRPFTRENIIAQTDPDVKIESKVISEARRFNDAQLFRGFVQMVAPLAGANIRFAMKHMGKLTGLKKDVIDQVIPQTVDELKAEEENIMLRNNERVNVSATDDHFMHIAVHNKMEDTPAKIAHINAHKRAMVLKKERPELFPPETPQLNSPDQMPDNPLPEPARDTSNQPVRSVPLG